MAQYGLLCIRHQIYSSIPCIRHQCGCTSYINMTRCCFIHSSKLCIRHQYAVYHASIKMPQYGSMQYMHHASIWVNAVHPQLHYDLMLCIRHHYGTINIAQCCAGINYLWPNAVIRHHNTAQPVQLMCIMIQYGYIYIGASMIQAVHHPSIWLNAAWLITHIILCPLPFLLHLKKKKKNDDNPVFCLVAGLLPWRCFRAI